MSYHKNNFWVIGEGPTDDISDSVFTTEKKFNINFGKAKIEYCLSSFFLTETKSMTLKLIIKMLTFQLNFA